MIVPGPEGEIKQHPQLLQPPQSFHPRWVSESPSPQKLVNLGFDSKKNQQSTFGSHGNVQRLKANHAPREIHGLRKGKAEDKETQPSGVSELGDRAQFSSEDGEG